MPIKKTGYLWGLMMLWVGAGLLTAIGPAAAQDRQPVAELIALAGSAEIKSPGDSQFRPAKVKDGLHAQDQFRTLANSRAKLFFTDESILVLSDNTTIDIANFQMTPRGERRSALMKILHGSLRFIVTKSVPGDQPNFEIQGTTAVMGVRGTDGVFETRSPDVIYFLYGRSTLLIRNLTTGERSSLSPNNFISAIPGQPLRPGIISPAMRQRLMGSFHVTQRVTPTNVSQPPPPPADLQAKLQKQQGQDKQCPVSQDLPCAPQGDQVQEQPTLGNPLIPQNNMFINTLNPGAQGGAAPVAPLPVVHQPAVPR